MSEKKNVPKLRFPEFTEPWEQRKLGDICSRVQGNDGRMNLPTLTISAANGWMNQEERFSGNIAGKEQKNYTLLHKGELSYNHGNSKLAKYGTVFSLQTYEEALVPRVYHSFRVENGSADFLEYYFATKLPDRELGRLISSGARMDGLLNIGYYEFMGIQMMFPTIAEQNRIAGYFRCLDTLITLHQRKLDHVKDLKKSMLQKMFPKNGQLYPEVRFPEFTDAWEQRKLGEIATFINGRAYSQPELLSSGKYKVLRVGNFYTNDSWYYSDLELGDKYYADYGDLLYTWSATFGPHIWLGDKVIYHYHIWKIDLSNQLEKQFAVQLLEQDKANILSSKNGSTMVHVTKERMEQKDVIIPPSIKEQQKIGAFFIRLDHLITLHQRELDHLKLLKKGMLQQMFV
jgi:type I restriction enzyme S subunit